MTTEVLHQNRIVIVGRNIRDAHMYSTKNVFRDELESPYLMASSSHRLTILGGTPSHVGTFYLTPLAPQGENYDVVLETIELARQRNPEVQVVEEPQSVSAL